MANKSQTLNWVLLAAAIILFAGSYIYRQWNEHRYSQLGVKVGQTAPEIELPDTAGKKIKLSSLRGNYVLVDFWAAWCRPCREENPNLMLAYETYSRKKMEDGAGFKILSVSADENAGAWKRAIYDDLLRGPIHVSDLNGWNSPVMADYGVRSIPHNVLIDPEGKILAVKLRGSALHEELEKHTEK